MQKRDAERIKMAGCTFLNDSAWSTEKKYIRRYKGPFDIFFGVEHIMRKEEMEKQLNKKAKHCWEICSRFSKDYRRDSK